MHYPVHYVIIIKMLLNIFKQKTKFAKVIVVGCYQVVFSGFGKFPQKKIPSVLPLFQFLLPMGQLTQFLLCTSALKEPAMQSQAIHSTS